MKLIKILEETEINQTINGKKEGFWRTENDNLGYRQEGNYVNGLKDGEWKLIDLYSYYIVIENFEKGVKKSSKSYNRDHRLLSKIVYRSDGIILFWEFNSDGHLFQTYQSDKIGTKVGPFRSFHLNGLPERIGQYDSDGLPTGEWETFYSNGKLWIKNNFKLGMEDGAKEKYNSDGILVEKVNFLMGSLDGKFETFFNSGSIKERGQYKKGMKDGTFDHFDPNGNLIAQEIWENDNLINIKKNLE